MILDRLRLELKIWRDRRASYHNPRQHLLKVLNSQTSGWTFARLVAETKLPVPEVQFLLKRLVSNGLVQAYLVSSKQEEIKHYKLTNSGLRQAQRNTPRS